MTAPPILLLLPQSGLFLFFFQPVLAISSNKHRHIPHHRASRYKSAVTPTTSHFFHLLQAKQTTRKARLLSPFARQLRQVVGRLPPPLHRTTPLPGLTPVNQSLCQSKISRPTVCFVHSPILLFLPERNPAVTGTRKPLSQFNTTPQNNHCLTVTNACMVRPLRRSRRGHRTDEKSSGFDPYTHPTYVVIGIFYRRPSSYLGWWRPACAITHIAIFGPVKCICANFLPLQSVMDVRP